MATHFLSGNGPAARVRPFQQPDGLGDPPGESSIRLTPLKCQHTRVSVDPQKIPASAVSGLKARVAPRTCSEPPPPSQGCTDSSGLRSQGTALVSSAAAGSGTDLSPFGAMGERNSCKKRCVSPSSGSSTDSECLSRPRPGKFGSCEDPSRLSPSGVSAACALPPESLLQALRMVSLRSVAAASASRSPPLSPRAARQSGEGLGKAQGRGTPEDVRNRSSEADPNQVDSASRKENMVASTPPVFEGSPSTTSGLGSFQKNARGIHAFCAAPSAALPSRRSPGNTGGHSSCSVSENHGAWLDDIMVPFLCDSRVRRFVLQTKSLADQNEPEKVNALFERALHAYQSTASAPSSVSPESPSFDFCPPHRVAAASPSALSTLHPCAASSLEVSLASGLACTPGDSSGDKVSSPSYLRRPIDAVPNPKRPASAAAPAESGHGLSELLKRLGNPVESLSTPAGVSKTETGVCELSPRPEDAEARSGVRRQGAAEKEVRQTPAASSPRTRAPASGVFVEEDQSAALGVEARGRNEPGEEWSRSQLSPRRKEEKSEPEAGDFCGAGKEHVAGRSAENQVSQGEEQSRIPHAENDLLRAKRKDREAKPRPGDEGEERAEANSEAAVSVVADGAEGKERREGEGEKGAALARSRRKCTSGRLKEAEAPSAREQTVCHARPDTDALSLLDHIIREHKMRSVKPAATVTGAALEALTQVFARHPDGISDPTVFSDEVVVPLLGLGEYMSARLFRMVDSHNTGTISLPMLKEFWANRFVLAAEDPTTIDEGFPSSKLPIYLLPASASPSEDSRTDVTPGLSEEVVPHAVKRGSARNFFNIVKQPGADSITADDLRPWVDEVLRQAPDMAFLTEPSASEFAARYVDSVITRIMFEVDTEDAGSISLKALKHSCLPHVWYTIRPGVELSVVRRFFSYEHFYVFYCTFHALDEDEDFLLDRSDVRRHDTHNMNIEVEERLFLQVARPFRSPKAGYMCFEDWIWFLLVYYDVTSERAIQFWFKIFDIDGDGVLRDHEIEVFFNAQVDRFRMRDDKLPTYRDFICPMCDALCVPYSSGLRCRDLLRDPISGGCFINCLLKRAAFQAMDDGETMTNIVKGNPWDRQLIELTPFEIFASQQYQELTARKGEECFIEESSSFLDESESSQSDEFLLNDIASAESTESV
ncbi:hypothetical protein TGDOM2_200400 [Toxoplasma gondii GAB2-2007-GAL-DOM2]|uniref:EF-hand domain-containing protein n=8 Tax=Toxoplasma gondii TaxID=5811 RepID=V4ZN39_TOXGV|nr:hypothetical protein TGVEG_200400 [Toxoplasma gondii VEG]KFG27940.1 hypothetical protein TGP89_200400 [Toxoplasma gondii p89]KFG29588.1 hypothetical protein TGDOM2_200400 [Toxoplasma gondii GAB2-2007-GAL-DOM2]KFG32682.1 hypothetical protein TGFOU_200400 [Toxoplasma gondii FOU]KFG99409.1 hypothetical protein TGVAND_200400 [Toxoplasma gondii VAND]KFH01547.1 hypothetical protein TGMAS_200400 [Toxoplasma gondii MAS]PUA83503.1 hypothetical protein TGBR9_200400 [Toxoplasma gondii TgCATBr9]RQX66